MLSKARLGAMYQGKGDDMIQTNGTMTPSPLRETFEGHVSALETIPNTPEKHELVKTKGLEMLMQSNSFGFGLFTVGLIILFLLKK